MVTANYKSALNAKTVDSVLDLKTRRWRLLQFPISVIKPRDYVESVRIWPSEGPVELLTLSPGIAPAAGSTGLVLEHAGFIEYDIQRSRSDTIRDMRFFARLAFKGQGKNNGILFRFQYIPHLLYNYSPKAFDRVELKLICVCDHHAIHHHLKSGDDLSRGDRQSAYGLYSRISGQPCRYCPCVAFLGARV